MYLGKDVAAFRPGNVSAAPRHITVACTTVPLSRLPLLDSVRHLLAPGGGVRRHHIVYHARVVGAVNRRAERHFGQVCKWRNIAQALVWTPLLRSALTVGSG